MGLFNRRCGSRPAAACGAAQLFEEELEHFAPQARAPIDRVQADREVREQGLVIAFFSKAINEPTRAENLDATRAPAANVILLNHCFPQPAAALGSVVDPRERLAETRTARHDAWDEEHRAEQDASGDG